MAAASTSPHGLLHQELREGLKKAQNQIGVGVEEWVSHCDAVTDSQLDRYLSARNQDLPAAMKMAQRAEEWAMKWKPREISPADISNALPSGCWRFGGFTRDKQPILIIDVGLWRPKEYTVDEYIRYVAFFMESQVIRMGSDGIEKGVVIFDMSGFSIWYNDLRMIQQLVNINQNMYPERLHLAVLVGVPAAFMAVWTVIRPWLDAATASKVHLFGTSTAQVAAGKQLLSELVDATALEVKYGGARSSAYPIPVAKPAPGQDYIPIDAGSSPKAEAEPEEQQEQEQQQQQQQQQEQQQQKAEEEPTSPLRNEVQCAP